MVKDTASDELNVSTTDRCEGWTPYNASSQVQSNHYGDVIMSASRLSGQDFVQAQIKENNQISVSLACVMGIHLWTVDSFHRGPVMRKMFPLDGVIMWGNYGRLDNSLWPIDPIWHRVSWSSTHCGLFINTWHQAVRSVVIQEMACLSGGGNAAVTLTGNIFPSNSYWIICDSALTHWSRDQIDAITQTTFSSAFFWTKIFEFRLQCHWSLFLRVQLTIFQHWFR